jgi:hypothetical protein
MMSALCLQAQEDHDSTHNMGGAAFARFIAAHLLIAMQGRTSPGCPYVVMNLIMQ